MKYVKSLFIPGTFLFILTIVSLSSAELTVLFPFPQPNDNGGVDYVFICNNIPQTNEYDWNFGDGQGLFGIQNENVYHTYVSNGIFNVSCFTRTLTEKNATFNLVQNNTLSYVINGNDSFITIVKIEHEPNNYLLFCNTPNLNATLFDWDFGDGQKLLNIPNQNVFHTFNDNDPHNITCNAKRIDNSTSSMLLINVGNINNMNESNISENMNDSFSEAFSNNTFDNPWIKIPAAIGTTDYNLNNNELEIVRTGSNGFGLSSLISENVSINVNDSTNISFDIKVISSSVRNGCGDLCTEFPGNIMLTVKDVNGNLSQIWFSYNNDGGSSHDPANNWKIIANGNAPTNEWLRNQTFRIRDYYSNTVEITQISIGGVGWDFDSFYDNININSKVILNQTPVSPTSQNILTSFRNITYTFTCGWSGFDATNFNWIVTGDNSNVTINTGNNPNIDYTFTNLGNYSITCIASNNVTSSSTVTNIILTNPLQSTQSSDPGLTSSLFLLNGTINNQKIDPNNRTIIVNPGDHIIGNITTQYTSTYGSNAVMVFAHTPSFGDPAQQCVFDGNFATPDTNIKKFNIDNYAPTVPGTYHIIFAFRGEYTGQQVCSSTNWAYGNPVWYDGNDLANISQSLIDYANINGRAQINILVPPGYIMFFEPMTTVTIIVKSNNQSSNNQNNSNNNGNNQNNSNNNGNNNQNENGNNNEGNSINNTNVNNQTINQSEDNINGTIIQNNQSINQSNNTSDNFNITENNINNSEENGSVNNIIENNQTINNTIENNTTNESEKNIEFNETSNDNGTYPENDHTIISKKQYTYYLNQSNPSTNENATGDIYITVKLPTNIPNNYVFFCNTPGFNATLYDWDFGDGQTITNVNQSNVYHAYYDILDHYVTCTAKEVMDF